MTNSVVRLFLGGLAGILFVVASHAQNAGSPSSSLISPATVENFIASYPRVKGKINELREQYDGPGELSGVAAWRAWAGVDGANSQLDSVVRAYGFPDFQTWVRTLSVTAQAYAFTQGGEDLDSRMAEALARIESDPNISESQRELMRQQLQHSAAAIAAMKPSQESIEAVKPYAEQLRQLFDDKG